MQKDDLRAWLIEALQELGGQGSVLEVSKIVWRNHRGELEASERFLYTWQYDLRWTATQLRKEGRLAENTRGEPWSLIP